MRLAAGRKWQQSRAPSPAGEGRICYSRLCQTSSRYFRCRQYAGTLGKLSKRVEPLFVRWPKKGSRVDSVSRLKLRGRRLLEHFQHHSVLRTPSVFNRLRASSAIRIPEGLRTPRTGAPVAHVFARMGLVHFLTSAMTSPKL